MASETRNCQNCHKDFQIEPDDFGFYEKIKVPAPTWCPECRFMRRFTFRNDRSLYWRECALCGKKMMAMFPSDRPFKVYCSECWWSDKWDPVSYGRSYDFSKPFLTQFSELINSVPLLNVWAFSNVNSEYANYGAFNKNFYLSYGTVNSEDIFYSFMINESKNCFDCYWVRKSELCFEGHNAIGSYNSKFLVNCRNCVDSWFLFDCANCQDCFMCTGLRSKSFYIRNRQYSREDYLKELDKIGTGSYETLERLKREFDVLIKSSVHKFSITAMTTNSTGDDLTSAKNAKHVFYGDNIENLRYSWWVVNYKDSYDVVGSLDSELMYEVSVGAFHNYMSKFVTHSQGSRYSEYSYLCHTNSNIFGSIGLRNKQYCILNKQYTKEEYESLVPKIIKHMNDMPYVDKKGRVYRYGEFFPPELSPFAYNETIAQEYFPLTKEQAIEQGYRWKDPDTRDYKVTLKSNDLPDHIKDVKDSIVNEIIQCAHNETCNEQCTRAFKVITEELTFYRRMNLPLPRLCPNCRHYQRLKQRNPLKLWHRSCMCDKNSHQHGAEKCPNEFETSYAPDRKEVVYCEQCYNSEIV